MPKLTKLQSYSWISNDFSHLNAGRFFEKNKKGYSDLTFLCNEILKKNKEAKNNKIPTIDTQCSFLVNPTAMDLEVQRIKKFDESYKRQMKIKKSQSEKLLNQNQNLIIRAQSQLADKS